MAKQRTKKKTAGKKTAGKKTAGKKTAGKKTAGKKSAKKSAKKAGKKAGKKAAKRAGKKSTKKAAPKKAAKKATKRAAPKKSAKKASKKAAPKRAAKKSAPKKAPKKASAKKATPKKVAGKAVTKPTPSVEPETVELSVGDAAPSFSLPDQNDAMVGSDSLAGTPYVVYFYPKDDTPGCTREACGFRDEAPAFGELGVRVLGVSPDTTRSHRRFADKYGLEFTLLSDTDKTLTRAYGAWKLKKNYGKEYWGVERSTFLVGADGTVKAVWRRVRVDGHVEAVAQAVRGLD